jgi:hypothetical protein
MGLVYQRLGFRRVGVHLMDRRSRLKLFPDAVVTDC